MTKCKILAFAGSTRKDSYNTKLVKIAADGANAAGADVTLLDLRDYSLPLYDGDLEETSGLPDNARKLKDLFMAHQGLLISSPEYNSSVSGVLKNTIDWISRPVPNETPLQQFNGKVAALMSASPGALGGLRGLVTLRSILGNIKVIVLPDQVGVSKANEAFSPDGRLKDEKQHTSIAKLGETLAKTLCKLSS
jgi:chromate reductase